MTNFIVLCHIFFRRTGLDVLSGRHFVRNLQLVKGGYEWFGVGYRVVKDGFGWFLVVTSGYEWVWVVTGGLRWVWVVTGGYRWLKVVMSGLVSQTTVYILQFAQDMSNVCPRYAQPLPKVWGFKLKKSGTKCPSNFPVAGEKVGHFVV